MKLVYAVLLLPVVIQLVLVKPLEASANTTPIQQYQTFLRKELNLLAHDITVKLKIMSDQILKDHFVQQAATPFMLNFRNNIRYFRHIYPIYLRYNLNRDLLYAFSNLISSYYAKSLYVAQMMEKFGYSKIVDEYSSRVRRSFSAKLLPNLMGIKNQISNIRWNKLMEWAKTMEECKDNACFVNNFNRFQELVFTSKEELFDYVQDQHNVMQILHAYNATLLVRGVLIDKRLSQLSTNFRQELTRNITEYIKQYESNHDVDEITRILLFFYDNILENLYSNETLIPLNDKQLLMKIFNAYGYPEFEWNYQLNFIYFMKGAFINKFNHFRKSLSGAELTKEKPILDWFDHFKSLTKVADIYEAYIQFYDYK